MGDTLDISFDLAYLEACNHARENTRCSHHAAVVIVDGYPMHIATNDASAHAEVNALDLFVKNTAIQNRERLKGGWGLRYSRHFDY